MSVMIPQFYNKPKDALTLQGSQLPLVTASHQNTNGRSAQYHFASNLEDRQVTFEADRYRPKQAQANLSTRALLKIAETKEAINEWLRETQQGNLYAGQSETHSVAVIKSALATVDAAEEAILDAAVARIDENRFEPCVSCRVLNDSLF